MIIENPEIFKDWLTSILEPLCDADPAALAKYVYALVKKEKPISELRDVMVDQLDVFLQHETKPFVEMLFKSLESDEYLKPREVDAKPPTPPPESVVEKEQAENEVPLSNGTASPRALVRPFPPGSIPTPLPPPPAPLPSAPAPAPARRVVVTRALALKRTAPHEQTLVKVLPLTELLEEPMDQPPRRRDRRNDTLRDKEDRRRRRSRSGDRRVRPRREPRHPREFDHERRYDARRLASRSPSPRRYRNRSPPPADRQPSRSRSRSPMGMRERELERERERLRVPRELERDRMSRDRDHRDRVSRSRERERSRDRSLERSVSPRDSRLDINDVFKRRCRDFDDKGYCMRGDLCQFDHGADPVVLEDAALSSVLTMPHPVPEYNPLAPDIWMAPGFPPYPPPHHPHPLPHPPRELIPIPRVRHEVPMPGALMPLPPRHPPPIKKNFDYNRIGTRPPLPANAVNCSLEVKKVPRGMNDITHLNNHFSKFGKIVNIQVCYEGDQEAALITFSNPTEANVAYKSTEAVLNNRFIKVFWHNPDSKQENMAPSNQQPNKPVERPNSQHPMSHNKVFINKDNIKATADTKQLQNEKEQKDIANGITEIKKDTQNAIKAAPSVDKSKKVMDMYKRGQELLETQLHQQILLIQKLESGNVTGAQKAALMEAINSAQEGIEKLRKELVAYNGTLKQMQEETVSRMSRLQLNQINAKKPKTREEAQKEILDTELDMFNKQQEGQDVTDLLKKILELRRQMALNFPVHSNIRRPISARGGRFNPSSMRFTRGVVNHAPKTFSTNTSVDHRPKALLISGFETDELDALYTHFSQFGDVSSKEVDLAVPQLVLQYKARSHAEQAMLHGKNYNDRTLSITWALSAKAAGVPEPKRILNGDVNDEHREEQFGDVSSKEVDLAVPQLVLQYKARSHAEQAMLHGKNYNDRTLSITWALSAKAAGVPEPKRILNGDVNDEHREEAQSSETTLLRSDEEDDEDNEARSWRR